MYRNLADLTLGSEAKRNTAGSFFDIWLGFSVTGLLYGGLHCAAWSAAFATYAEKILWRVSAAAVVLAPLGLLHVLAYTWKPDLFNELRGRGSQIDLRPQDSEQTKQKETTKASTRILGRLQRRLLHVFKVAVSIVVMFVAVISPLFWFCYAFGRIFLVVECFLNLAHLTPEAFKTVDWPGYVPHIA